MLEKLSIVGQLNKRKMNRVSARYIFGKYYYSLNKNKKNNSQIEFAVITIAAEEKTHHDIMGLLAFHVHF